MISRRILIFYIFNFLKLYQNLLNWETILLASAKVNKLMSYEMGTEIAQTSPLRHSLLIDLHIFWVLAICHFKKEIMITIYFSGQLNLRTRNSEKDAIEVNIIRLNSVNLG